MAPRKRLRRDDGEGNPTKVKVKGNSPAPTPPQQPSRATTTSQVSPLSAAGVPELPTATPVPTLATVSTPRSELDKGMPPPPLPKLDSSITKDGKSGPEQQGNKLIHKTKSWYGSLSRKSTASTSLQREEIASSPLKAGSTPDFHRYDLKRTGDTASLSGASQSSVTAPSSDQTFTAKKDKISSEETEAIKNKDGSVSGGKTANGQAAGNGSNFDGNAVPDADTPMPDASSTVDNAQQSSTSTGWLGGLGLFGSAPAKQAAEAESASLQPKEAEPEPPGTPAPAIGDHSTQTATAGQRAASYLFYLWPNQSTPSHGKEGTPKEAQSGSAVVDTPMEDAPAVDPEPGPKPSAGSTWAFWSVSRPLSSGGEEPEAPETGEVAVLGEGSERHPKQANSVDMSRPAKGHLPKEDPLKAKSLKDKPGKKTKKTKPQSMDLDDVSSRPQTPKSDAASIKAAESPSRAKAKMPTTAIKSTPPNLILPSFTGTYRMKENPSILKQISALLLRTKQLPAKHVFRTQNPPKIKKAIAIGVHGLFPAAYLRAMIGQPTGTSLKFANLCADGIQRWADSHGCGDCVISKVALEGEGRIETRVANLWNLLQNWMDHIRDADLVVVACHSQGVPVSVMLLEKLVESGAISRAKVGVCAMAGVSLGPFPEYRGSMGMFMGTAAELWELADSESAMSRRYETALKKILSTGVRITYVGSIDDQLVPMESAIYSPASHPYIYRACFVDGRLHAPDFIAHLVGFACKLRNLGISDHGLVRELSVPLAGSLYGGEGHSRLYEDGQVYDLAIAHALETTDLEPPGAAVECEIRKYDGKLGSANPYLLPWIMRGLLEEDLVKTGLSQETEELLRQFDDWKPVKKELKDVKFRLEAVRSKL